MSPITDSLFVEVAVLDGDRRFLEIEWPSSRYLGTVILGVMVEGSTELINKVCFSYSVRISDILKGFTKGYWLFSHSQDYWKRVEPSDLLTFERMYDAHN